MQSTVLGWYRGIWHGKIQYMPVWAVKKLHQFYSLDYDKTEKKIILYRAFHGKPIKNPKLPIKESVEIFQIIGHLFGDGSVINKKERIPSYCNTNSKVRKEFIFLLKKTFGDVPCNEMSKWSILTFSKAITKILIKFYKINSFETFTSSIPMGIKKKNPKLLSGIIKAFIIDEGSIRDNGIDIYSGNFNLLRDLQDICARLGYRYSQIHKGAGVFYLKILSDSLSKLALDIGKLPCKHKDDKLHFLAGINRKQGYSKGRNVTVRNILQLLSKEPMSSLEISYQLGIKPTSIRDYHLKKLRKTGLVTRNTDEKEYLWSINHNRLET